MERGWKKAIGMVLMGRLALISAAVMLLVIAVPWGLVRLDLLPARVLRLIPAALAIVVAGTFLTAALVQRKRGGAP